MSRSTNYVPISDVLHKLEIIGNQAWPDNAPNKKLSACIVNGDTFLDGRVNIGGNLTVSGSTNIGAVQTENFSLTGGQESWILRSDANSTGKWGKPYFKTNDSPVLNISGPSDNMVHTEYFIGVGVTSPSVPLEVSGSVILGDQFIGNYNGSPTDTTIISHKSYKADNDGYAIKIKNDSQLDLNSKVDMNFNISDSQVMTIDNYGNVGIGITQPNENLHVGGNVQIDGNLNVEGDLTYIKSTVVEVNDPNIFLARNNPSDVMDIGVFGQYVDNGVTKYTGIFRDASGPGGYYNFFHNLEEKPTTTVNTSGTGYQNGNLHLGGLQVDSGITFSTNDAFIYEDNLILDSRSGDGNGMVGIGLTSAPLDSMDVNNGVIIRNGNLKIGITSSNASVHINRSDVIVIPIGTDNQRLDITGGIRYNTDNSTFEGFDGTWRSLGGVIDTDQDTKITSEDSAGIDNDQLRFYTGGLERMIINNDGTIGIGVTSSGNYQLEIDGSIGINGSIIPKTDGIYNLGSTSHRFGDLFFGGETIHLGDSVLKDYDGVFTVTGPAQMEDLKITQNLDINGNIDISGIADINSLNVTGTIVASGQISASSINLTGDGDVNGNFNLSGAVDIGGTAQINSLNVTDNIIVDGNLKVDNMVGIGITPSGNYKVEIEGDIGIEGHMIPKTTETYDLGTTSLRYRDLFLSGNSIHLGDTLISADTGSLTVNNLSVTDSFHLNSYINNLNVTENTNITQNLNVSGNITCIGDTEISGNLTIHGSTTTVNTQIVTIEDPIIHLASNNISNSIDMGFYGKYVDNGVTKYSGLVKDASVNEFKLFTIEEEPTTVVNTSAESYSDAKLKLGDLDASGSINIQGSAQINSLNITGDTDIDGTLDIQGVASFQDDLVVDTNTLFVDVSTDRVGINNATPGASLHLTATDAIVIPVGTNDQRVDITGAIRYNSEIATFEGYKGTWGSLGGVIDIDQDTYITAETSASDNDELKFVTSGAERMIINSIGNIGIGTNNPTYPLQIEKINLNNWSTKIINSDTEILIANTNGSALNINSGVSSTNTNYIMNVKNNTNSSILTIMNNEKIGINNSNPSEKLDIATTSFSEGANIGYGFIGNSSNETTTTIFTHKDLKSNNDEYAIKQDRFGKTTLNSKTDLNLGINNTSKIIIKSDGKIGIHTLTPNANVEIQDNTLINSQTGISLTVTNNLSNVYLANTDGSGILIESGTTSKYALQCKENTNPLFEVLNTGNVVIGITETDSKLSVEDNLTINHNDSYIKSNTTDSLNTINSNVPISLGVSANEILYINENKVTIDSNSINYQKFNVNGSQYISDSLLINTTQSNYQLDVSGNTNLNGDVLISGLLTFEGVAVDGLEFQDSLIKFGNNNTDNTEDIGFYGQYVSGLVTKYAGIVKDASDDKFKLFKDLETEPTTTVDLTDVSYAYADLSLNNLETSGNIGVGVVNPQYSLHINGTDAIIIPVGTNAQRVDVTGAIRYNSENETFEGYKGTWGSLGGVIDVDQDTYISAETSAGTDNDELKFVTSGLERMIIDSTGKVGIGITNPTYALDVNGIIQSNDEIFAPEFTTACDIRVKENIKRMNVDGILEKVNKLNLYEYNYVNGYNKSNDKIYGLIAQNVKEIMPEAIKLKKLKVGDKYINDFQTISQNTLISSLIGCIHKLTDNQRDLGNELYQLKKDYYELKNSLILKNELNDLKK
jgi:cytoskeletal protein CcmA (bactofilin family)